MYMSYMCKLTCVGVRGKSMGLRGACRRIHAQVLLQMPLSYAEEHTATGAPPLVFLLLPRLLPHLFPSSMRSTHARSAVGRRAALCCIAATVLRLLSSCS